MSIEPLFLIHLTNPLYLQAKLPGMREKPNTKSLGSNIGLVYSLKVTHQKGYPSLRLEKENVKDTQEEIYKKTSITIWRMN